MGTISSLQVLNYVLSPDQVRFLSKQVPESAGASDLMPGGERRTQDGRVCLSPCSPEEPFQEEEHLWTHPTNPSIELACTDNGWLPAFNGFTDSRFLIRCPEDCHKAKAPLKGSKVYTPDTSVCKAAIHVGVLDLHGGDAVLVVHNGINNYTSGTGKHGNVLISPNWWTQTVIWEFPRIGQRCRPRTSDAVVLCNSRSTLQKTKLLQ